MVYLIGGPPRVGKSTLARLLAKEKAIQGRVNKCLDDRRNIFGANDVGVGRGEGLVCNVSYRATRRRGAPAVRIADLV